LDNVTEDCKCRGWDIVEATHLVADRQYWKSCVRLSQHALKTRRREKTHSHLANKKYNK